MPKFVVLLIALTVLSACNGYNPVSAAAQDAHNRALKASVSPEGYPLPETMVTTRVVAQ